MFGERKRRQPGFAAQGPTLIARQQLVRRIQRTEVHLDFIAALGEYRRAAARAEVAPRVVMRFPLDGHRLLREHCRSKEQRTMVLAAVEAMANPDPIRPTCSQNSHVAAQAATGELVHAALLSISRCQDDSRR